MNTPISRLLASVFCVCLFAASLQAAALSAIQTERILLCPKNKTVTVADGINHQDGKAAKEGTLITLTWNDAGMDVVFDCTDSAIADKVATKKDGVTWKDDSVCLFLDVGHTHDAEQKIVALKLSAAGGLHDRLGKDDAYTLEGATSKLTRTDKGWQGTLHIPWKGLGTTPKEGDVWGLNFGRIDHEGKTYANMKFLSWVPFAKHFEEIDHWGHVVFAPADSGNKHHAVQTAKAAIQKKHEKLVAPQAIADRMLLLPQGETVTTTGFTAKGKDTTTLQKTDVSFKWTGDALVVTFVCTDNAIAAVYKDHDHIKMWKDDCVGLWLDMGHTHNAKKEHLLVQVSATGAIHDVNNGKLDYNVEGATTKITTTTSDWTCLLTLPWKGLGITPKPGDVWGVNLTRFDHAGQYDAAKGLYTSWAPVGDKGFDYLDAWGHLLFAAPKTKNGEAALNAFRTTIDATHELRAKQLLGK